MNSKKEAWGTSLELLGLIFVLLSIFWQATFSGWWDRQIPEWHYYIQEEVNLAVLDSLNNLSNIQTSEDKRMKEQFAQYISDTTNTARLLAINERNKLKVAMKTGQAATFWSIQSSLVIIGALLLVIGKFFTLLGVKD